MYFWQKLFIVSFLLKLSNYLLQRSVQFSWSVISDYLQPQWLQHSRPPCPSPTSTVYSNTCPLTWWWHPTISSSVVTFSFHLPSFPASGSFPMSHGGMFWVSLRHQFTCLLNSKIKNCERSNILPNLQANKSTCHSFLGIGIKNTILGSNTKGFDIWGIESSVIIGMLQQFPCPRVPGLMLMGSDLYLHIHWALL